MNKLEATAQLVRVEAELGVTVFKGEQPRTYLLAVWNEETKSMVQFLGTFAQCDAYLLGLLDAARLRQKKETPDATPHR